jgi:Family of unknown function (DUF6610)
VDLIFCFNNSPTLTQIALNYGFLYGHRTSQAPLPNPPFPPPAFLDLDHRHPTRDFPRHLALAAQHQPKYAIAGDATTPLELDAALARAALLHAASPATLIIIVPKTVDLINNTPTDPPFMTGYSLPTEFGATLAPPAAYGSAVRPPRKIHILGGPPKAQIQAALSIDPTLANIISVDTNAHVKAAQVGTYWDAFTGKWKRLPINTRKVRQDALIPAFVRSSRSIMQAWAIWASS